MSNSLDPDQEFCWSCFGSKLFAKIISGRLKSSTSKKRIKKLFEYEDTGLPMSLHYNIMFENIGDSPYLKGSNSD